MSKQTLIPVGPYHPLQEEPELFKLYCEGEIVKDVKWETGYNHRGIEKLSEKKSYDEVFFLVERICGICSTSHPFAFANSRGRDRRCGNHQQGQIYQVHHRRTGKNTQSPALGRSWQVISWVIIQYSCGHGNTGNLFWTCLK